MKIEMKKFFLLLLLMLFYTNATVAQGPPPPPDDSCSACVQHLVWDSANNEWIYTPEYTECAATACPGLPINSSITVLLLAGISLGILHVNKRKLSNNRFLILI